MTTETTARDAGLDRIDIAAIRPLPAIVGGLAGTVAFGGLQHLAGGAGAIAMAIPALYGVQGPALAVGWLIHLAHGAGLGLAYAAVASHGPLLERSTRLPWAVGFGVAYGVLTTVALAGLVMPLWLGAVGFPNAPPIPNVALPGLVGHIAYGVVLALVYAVWPR